MKKTNLIFLATLFVSFSFTKVYSQITYSSNDFAAVDDSFMVSKTNSSSIVNYDFQQTGANYTWDYSTLIAGTQKYQKFIDADNSGYKATWVTNCVLAGGNTVGCNNSWNNLTNICLKTDDTLVIGSISLSDIADLYNKNTDVLEQSIKGMTIGLGQLPIKMITNYNDADTIYNFPIQYLNEDSSSSFYTIDFNSIGIDLIENKHQKRINYVEGWGSLITPYDTFSSVLKMKTLIYHNDTTFYGGNFVPSNQTIDVIYQWFDTAYGIPVLKVKGKIAGNTEIYSEASYIDSIRCLQPNALFAYTPLIPYVDGNGNANVTFTNLSSNSNTYNWDFDDGNTSVQTNPTHTFTNAGTYNVQLVATNTICVPYEYDTLIIPVIVKDSNAVAANFYYTPIHPCNGDTVFFTNTSLNATNYFWDFGDGNTSAMFEPFNIYSAGGSFDVKLIASDNITSDSTIKVITINTNIVDAGNDTIITLGDTAYLHVAGGTGVYVWQYDTTLSCVVCNNPVANPTTTTTYYVSKVNTCGTTTDSITVHVNPVYIGENKNNYNIKIYPNPTSQIFTIENIAGYNITMTDVSGKTVFSQLNCTENKLNVDVSNFNKGVYFVKVYDNKNHVMNKVILY